jgi:hypothetical protein
MRWEELRQGGILPQARSSHTLTCVDSEVLVLFAGEHRPREPIGSDVLIFGLQSRSWSQPKAAGVVPCPRVAHGAAAVGSNVFVFGGRTEVNEASALGDTHSTCHAFNMPTATWTAIDAPNPPPARNYHAMVSDGTCLYVFGGCSAAGRLNDLWRLETRAANVGWEQLPAAPLTLPEDEAATNRCANLLMWCLLSLVLVWTQFFKNGH